MTSVRAVKPNKARLGQNFLVDDQAARRIVDALGDVRNAKVIEIGPGKGAITKILAEKAKKLIAIELDRMLAARLRAEYSTLHNVEIIDANVLSVDFDTLVQGNLIVPHDRQINPAIRAQVVGNLPYYITSDILLHLFKYHRNFETIVIMVQREVAERIAADPGSRDYGLLTVTTQLYCDIENLFTLPPQAFSPPPKVHSGVLRLRVNPKAARLEVEEGAFTNFLKACFAQKRKVLTNNLKQRFGAKVAAALSELEIRSDVRAETMSLEQLAAVYKKLQ